MTEKVDAFECEECGSLYDHPSLAGRCEKQCKLYYLLRDIGDELDEDSDMGLNIHPDVETEFSEYAPFHSKIFIADVIEGLEKTLEYLEETEIPFGDEHIPGIKARDKTATIRYDEGLDVERGDVLRLTDYDGNVFGKAVVHRVDECHVYHALEKVEKLHGTHNRDSWKELRDGLQQYYDDEITGDTTVQVIVFRLQDDE